MQPILTRCGYRCDLCLAYRPNVESQTANRQKLSDGWFRYFGFHLPPEEICCDGCLTSSPHLIDQDCPVRSCVLDRQLENCAQCAEPGCPRLAERLVSFEEVQQRTPHPIPLLERAWFILPYENQDRLQALRPSATASFEAARNQLVEDILNEYCRLESLLAKFSPAMMLQPERIGKWSIKDTLAHITAHQQRMLDWMEVRLRGEIPVQPQPYAMPDEPLSILNEQIYQQQRHQSLDEVLRNFDQLHAYVLELVCSPNGVRCFDPTALHLENGEPLAAAIAANTWEHLVEHGQDIEECLK